MIFTLFLNNEFVSNIVGDITGDKEVIKEFGGILGSDIVYIAEIDNKITISMRMEGQPEKKYEIRYSDESIRIDPIKCIRFGSNYLLSFYVSKEPSGEDK